LLGKEDIPPGGEGQVAVKISTTGRSGKISRAATVETDDPKNARVTLTVSANVLVDLDFERTHLRFTKMKPGDENVQVMGILAKNPGAVVFGEVTSTLEGLEAKLIKGEKEGTAAWSLELRYKANTVGKNMGRVELKVLKPEDKVLSLNVSVQVEGNIKAVPSVLSLRKPADASMKTSGTVTLKADEGTFTIKKIEEAMGYLKIKREVVTPGKEYRIIVEPSKKSDVGDRFSTNIFISTDSSQQPKIQVPVHYFSGKIPVGGGSKSLKGSPKKVRAVPSVKVLPGN